MKIQLLPSSFEPDGTPSLRQHTTCFIIDDRVALDAGSLGQAANEDQRALVRDIILTHAHLDHIAGLPLFVDDLFATLDRPVRVHAERSVLEILRRDIFNWSVYPDFTDLSNKNGPVIEFAEISPTMPSTVAHLTVIPIEVNHRVPSCGFIVSDGTSKVAITGDTAAMEEAWLSIGKSDGLDGLLIECAFPDELEELAAVSHHLTPKKLEIELSKFTGSCPIYIINIKPMYREKVIDEISRLSRKDIEILEVGREYDF